MLASALLLLHAGHHPTGIIEVLAQGGFPGDPKPEPLPNGAAGAVQKIVNMIKWTAGIGLVALFFAGLIAFGAGRAIDHHHYGRIGTKMMVCAVGGALLYASGYSMIHTFATGQ